MLSKLCLVLTRDCQESGEGILAGVDAAFKELETDPSGLSARLRSFGMQYAYSKHIRGDNSVEMAKYLGYLDATELYPSFKPIGFKDYLAELLAGKAVKPYPYL